MARITNGSIEFINCDPEAPYGLGVAVWVLEVGDCPKCGAKNKLEDIQFYYFHHDGFLRENPYCPVCHSTLHGRPKQR